jgi:hypothetical protein
MAAFCRFWRVTPADYWALTIAETRALTDFANEEIAARRKAIEKAQRQRRVSARRR